MSFAAIYGQLRASASDLHLCQRCPRLLAYRKSGKGDAWRVGLKGSGIAYGRQFHDHIAGAFHSDASNPESPNRALLLEVLAGRPEELRERLADFVRTCYFIPFLAAHGSGFSEKKTMGLAHGTDFWVSCLADFLAGLPSLLKDPAGRIASVFCEPEKLLYENYSFADGTLLRVAGKYDCALFDCENGTAELFEFKGHKILDPIEELAQTLVYAWLIHMKTGVVPGIRVVYLEEEAPILYPSDSVAAMMNNLPHLFNVTRRVLELRVPLPDPPAPSLCGSCRYETGCDTDWGRRKFFHTERFAPGLEENTPAEDEGQTLMDRLVETMGHFGVAVEDGGYVLGPAFVRLKVRPAKGVTVRKIENKAEDLQVALELQSPPLIQPQSGYVSVDVPRKSRTVLMLDELMEKAAPNRPKSDAAFPLGLDIEGKAFWVDLAEPTMTSILIGGTSGSGKSVLLRSIVAALSLSDPRGGVLFTLIDPKRVTFTDMKDMDCIDEGRAITDIDAAMDKLSLLVEEMEDRYLKMEHLGVQDISSYNALPRNGAALLKRRVVLIDEYADMVVSSQMRKDLETAVQRISQKGRAAGIHLVLATQRPDRGVVTGLIKANLQLRIALKVMSQTNSMIILDEGQAQYLLGHGDMLVGGSVLLQRLQGALPSAENLKRLP